MKKIVAILTAMIMVMSVLVVFAGGVATTKEKQPEKVDQQIFENKELNVLGGEEFVADEILVKFKPGVGKEKIDNINSKHGAFVRHTSPYTGTKGIGIPKGTTVAEMVKLYQAEDEVEYAEPNYIAHALMVPNDPFYNYQWHLDNPEYGGIQMEEAWDIQTGSFNVVVAVIDTGVAYEDYTQRVGLRTYYYYRAPDLANTIFVPGYDFVNKDTHPNDDNSHGTHVAGTIAQSTNNGVGVAGVAFNTAIMPVKVLDKYGSGTYLDVAEGICYAADNGADVISMSLGASSPSTDLENALAYAYEKGVTIVAAAGNDGAGGPPSYPAAYDDYVIAVAATRYDETRSYYSTTGDYVDIAAPGGDLKVDQNNDGYGDGVLQNTFNPNTRNTRDFGYWFFQGTSMAAPHVAGVAALLYAQGVSAPNEIRNILQSTAEDKTEADWTPEYGWGIVDAYAALQATVGPPDETPPVISGATGDTTGTTGEAKTISATITDNVGVTSATVHYTPIDGTETTVPMTVGDDDVWSADVPVASNKVGTITYYITAQDAAGNTTRDPAEGTYIITVTDNDAPIAEAGPNQEVLVGQEVIFDGSGSSDNIGITSYSWDFNASDGIQEDATGVTATHIYNTAAGTYIVTLTVSDAAGNTASDTLTVTVSEAPTEVVEFEDSFEGSEWNGLWIEDAQNDWFVSTQRATDRTHSAEVDGSATDATLTMANPINLGGKASATLTFSWFIESSWDAGEYICLDMFYNGAWHNGVASINGASRTGPEENHWIDVISISMDAAYFGGTMPMPSDFKIRFRAKVSDSVEDGNVDNVTITSVK